MMPTQRVSVLNPRDLEIERRAQHEAGMGFSEKIAEAAREAAKAGLEFGEVSMEKLDELVNPVKQVFGESVDPNSYIRVLMLGYFLGTATVISVLILSRFI